MDLSAAPYRRSGEFMKAAKSAATKAGNTDGFGHSHAPGLCLTCCHFEMANAHAAGRIRPAGSKTGPAVRRS